MGPTIRPSPIGARLRDWSPEVAVVLGSGLDGVASCAVEGWSVSWSELSDGIAPTVPGHAGRLVCGTWRGRRVLIFRGRLHVYEGHDLETVCFPVRWASACGVRMLILGNAAGGIRDDLHPGMLMLVSGWLSWHHPGRRHAARENAAVEPGSRDIAGLPAEVRDPASEKPPPWAKVHRLPIGYAGEVLQEVSRRIGVPLQQGILAGVPGPNYETPAEIRALRCLGADAVGMSTVVELQYAVKIGLPVLAISCITNRAAGLTPNRLSHEEVLQQASRMSQGLARLLDTFLQCWPGPEHSEGIHLAI